MLRFTTMIGAAFVAVTMLAAGHAQAGAEDYRFETAGNPVKAGGTTLIQLRLVHVPDGKPVAGAILIQPKLEMGEGHDAMAAPVKVAPALKPDLYAVEAKPSMDGEWHLTIVARVPGETAAVRGRLTVDLAQ